MDLLYINNAFSTFLQQVKVNLFHFHFGTVYLEFTWAAECAQEYFLQTNSCNMQQIYMLDNFYNLLIQSYHLIRDLGSMSEDTYVDHLWTSQSTSLSCSPSLISWGPSKKFMPLLKRQEAPAILMQQEVGKRGNWNICNITLLQLVLACLFWKKSACHWHLDILLKITGLMKNVYH